VALPTQLASLADLEAATGRTFADVERAERALDAATALARGYCGWPVSAFDHREEWIDTDEGGAALVLPCVAVTAVHEATQNGAPVSFEGFTRNGVVWGTWPRRSTVRVVYSGGLDPVPAAVVAAVCSIALRVLNAPVDPDGDAPELASETIGPVSWTYHDRDPASTTPELTATERLALDPYRLETAFMSAAL